MYQFINHILINIISWFGEANGHAAVIPVWYQKLKHSLVIVEDWVTPLHSCLEVQVKRSRNQFSEGHAKLTDGTLKNLHGFCDDKDASPLLPDATSGSLLPLVQQDVAVGASIEVSFGPVSGPRVAYSGISFSFHRINLDNQIATGYQNSATVAFNH